MEWRRPNSAEELLLRKLLTHNFRGRDELTRQLAAARVRVIDDEGSLEFRVSSRERAPVVRRVPIEAEANDRDGIVIHALLHVVDGQLKEFEFYKDDSSRILRLPPAKEWEIIALPEGGS
jgi:hypothetical protein